MFSLIYELYVDEIYNYSYYLTSDKHKAQDLCSDVFMKALEKVSLFEGEPSQLKAWLYKITRSTCIDNHRRERSPDIDYEIDRVVDGGEEVSTQVEKKAMMDDVYIHLDQLEPLIYKEVLLLRYKFDLTNREISEIINKSEEATKKVLQRALSKLKNIINEG